MRAQFVKKVWPRTTMGEAVAPMVFLLSLNVVVTTLIFRHNGELENGPVCADEIDKIQNTK